MGNGVSRVGRRYWWLSVALLLLGTLLLGLIGFESVGDGRSLSDSAYRSLQLFSLESGTQPNPVPWEIEVARYLAPIGALILTIGVLGEVVRAIRTSDWRMWPERDHVIICGLGEKGSRLALSFAEVGQVVAIERNKDAPSIDTCRDAGVRVIPGSAEDPTRLERAGIHRARRLIAALGDDGENAKVTAVAREIVERTRGRPRDGQPLRASAHIFDRELAERLAPLLETSTESFAASAFNVYVTAAERLVASPPIFGSDASLLAHRLMLIGFGALAESVVLAYESRWTGEVGQATFSTSELVPHFAIVDRDATKKKDDLLERHPELRAFDFNAIDIDVEGVAFEHGDFLRDLEHLDVILVTFDDDAKSVITALTLAQVLEEERRPCPILTRVHSRREGLASILQDGESSGTYGSITPFSVLESSCTPWALEVAERVSRRARISYDAQYDRLLISKVGDLIDDQLSPHSQTQVGDTALVIHRGGDPDGPPIGVIVQPLSDWEPCPELDAGWTGPRWDVEYLQLQDATPAQVIGLARERLGGTSTRDAQLFHDAIAAGEHRESAPGREIAAWREVLATGNLKGHFGLGYSLVEAGRGREALGHLRRYTQLVPDNAWAWTWLGRASESIGDLRGARRAYMRAMRVTERTGEATVAAELLAALEIRSRWPQMNDDEKVEYLSSASDAVDLEPFAELENHDAWERLMEGTAQRWRALLGDEQLQLMLWGPVWRLRRLEGSLDPEDVDRLRAEARAAWRKLSFDEKVEGLLEVESLDDVQHALGWEPNEDDQVKLLREAQRRAEEPEAT